MKNSETGEFELVLGNKQLLSGFFIVVILFGVFFTMGYIVGTEFIAGDALAAAADTQTPAQGVPQPEPTAPPVAASAPEQAPVVQDASQQEPAAPAVVRTETPKPVKAPEAAPPAPAAAAPAEPAAGETYLQVMAVKRPEAEVVVKALRDKGFRASMGPGPNDLVRVLVGPFSDGTSLGTAKANLENAGFHPIVRK